MAACCEIQPQRKAEEAVAQVQHYRPDVDIFETESEYILHADVPGSSAESVSVEYDKGKLAIWAKTAQRPKPEGSKPLLMEYGVADFYRSFEVGEAVDIETAAAKYADGVLTITLKKKRNVQRKIPISIN